MTKVKMWSLTIRIKKNDQLHGKRFYNVLLDFVVGAGISRSTVINGVDAFRRRGKYTLRIGCILVNYPLVIEVVDEQSKLDPLLLEIKRMVGDNGLVTI
jgi:PII-like signaling protein